MYLIPKYFNEHEIGQIEALAGKKNIRTSKIGPSVTDPDAETQTGNTDERIRQATNAWIEPNELPQNIHDKLWAGTMEAKQSCGWNYNIEYMEPGQYTIYEESLDKFTGDFYTWHTDATPNLYDNGMQRKISTCVQLSDPDDYEGGNVQLLDEAGNSYMAPRKKGCIMLFDSRTQHRVLKVTKGTRKSIVGWTVGPRWK